MSTQEPRAPESAGATSGAPRGPWWQRLHARNRALLPAQAGTMSGAMWAIFVAVEFYLFSNPLVFIPWFEFSWNTGIEMAVIFLLVQAPRLRWRLPPASVVLFTAFTALSASWSQFDWVTWINVQVYLSIAVVAWLIATNVSPRVLSHGLLLGGVLVVLLSLYAVHEHLPGAEVVEGNPGYIAGVGTNRNILAYVLAPVCAVIAMPPRSRLGWLVWAPAVVTVLAGLWLAGSATGLVSAAAAFVTAALLVGTEWTRRHLSRGRRLWMWAAVTALVSLLVWFVRDIADLLGRDTTFSGRLPIWEATWQTSQPQLWQGFGWGAVWPHPWVPAPPNPVIESILVATDIPNYYPPHGHSSFFDLLPEVGLIGVALAALIHVETLVRAMATRLPGKAEVESVASGRMVIVLLVVLVVFGLSEPLTTIPFGWFLLVLACGVLPFRRPAPGPGRGQRRLEKTKKRRGVP
ncbi:MAG: O-antigen ligase family protein [Nocardioides sp.]|uniref:O-antigen ligase family protein n=1 Tax=Nocardioides sp. TaxID=35761 RepID=UPI0032664C05